MSKIDKKLDELFLYLQNYLTENGFPPTVRDICKDLSIKSTATAHYYLNKLKDKGLLNKVEDKKRALSVKNKCQSISIPLVGTITAGTPIFAVENFDGYVPIPDEFKTEEDLFMLKVKGDSMIDAGIFNGDKIIVKKQQTAENGDIVVALLDDSATVKRFFKKKDKFILHPENTTMQDIIVDNVMILGVVSGLIRKF